MGGDRTVAGGLRGTTAQEWYRAVLISLTLTILALTACFWIYGFFGPPAWRLGSSDLTVYTDATQRLLAGGRFYLERQLHGPYEIQHGDVLYPPVTAWLFSLWLVLPGWSFVLIPVAITAWAVWRLRPAMWTWPLIALCLLWPMTGLKTLRANPDVWVTAAVAMGAMYGWPGGLVLLKPSFLPFAAIGIRRRGWWVLVAVLALASLPVLADTLSYPGVILDSRGGGISYSLPDLPFALLPLVAWVGRRRTGSEEREALAQPRSLLG